MLEASNMILDHALISQESWENMWGVLLFRPHRQEDGGMHLKCIPLQLHILPSRTGLHFILAPAASATPSISLDARYA